MRGKQGLHYRRHVLNLSLMSGETNDSIAVRVHRNLHNVVFYSVIGTGYSSKILHKDEIMITIMNVIFKSL